MVRTTNLLGRQQLAVRVIVLRVDFQRLGLLNQAVGLGV